MTARISDGRVLRQVNLGFALILFINWVAEIFRFPHLLYGDPFEFNWFRVLLRSAVIIGVWAWSYFAIRRLIRRLHHLEDFVLVCSWCRRVGQEGEWLTMEQYFGTKFHRHTSHGVCPECARKARDHLAQQIEENSGKS
ncbi:MAG: hypothetical protein JWQ62_1911 [Lacunisphaera sp.]|nr:hypothetical protein [Lacunisphaera sp.]